MENCVVGNRSIFTGFTVSGIVSCMLSCADIYGNVYRSSTERMVSGFQEKSIISDVERGSPYTSFGAVLQ